MSSSFSRIPSFKAKRYGPGRRLLAVEEELEESVSPENSLLYTTTRTSLVSKVVVGQADLVSLLTIAGLATTWPAGGRFAEGKRVSLDPK